MIGAPGLHDHLVRNDDQIAPAELPSPGRESSSDFPADFGLTSGDGGMELGIEIRVPGLQQNESIVRSSSSSGIPPLLRYAHP